MTHSPEPWTAYHYGDSECLIAWYVASGGFSEEQDAKRAVLCVNLLAGVPTTQLLKLLAVPDFTRDVRNFCLDYAPIPISESVELFTDLGPEPKHTDTNEQHTPPPIR